MRTGSSGGQSDQEQMMDQYPLNQPANARAAANARTAGNARVSSQVPCQPTDVRISSQCRCSAS
ncbi:MAG: hypothetical protein ACLTCQ_11580 [Enterocloster bolteae]